MEKTISGPKYAEMSPEEIHEDLEMQLQEYISRLYHSGITSSIDDPHVVGTNRRKYPVPGASEIQALATPEKVELIKAFKNPKLLLTPAVIDTERILVEFHNQKMGRESFEDGEFRITKQSNWIYFHGTIAKDTNRLQYGSQEFGKLSGWKPSIVEGDLSDKDKLSNKHDKFDENTGMRVFWRNAEAGFNGLTPKDILLLSIIYDELDFNKLELLAGVQHYTMHYRMPTYRYINEFNRSLFGARTDDSEDEKLYVRPVVTL